MRVRKVFDGFSVQAVAGAYVVMLGMDIPKAKATGLLGFAIQRIDHEKNEKFFIKAMKVFKSTEPDGLGAGVEVSTRDHPIQGFQFSDFTVLPGKKYTFGVVKAAQARGDFAVLAERGRRALRVHLGPDVSRALEHLTQVMNAVLGRRPFSSESQR